MRLFRWPALLVLLAAVSACANTTETSRTVLGGQRSYRLVTRKNHDPTKPSPVLFALHAYSTPDGVLERHYDVIRDAAGKRDWILVIPHGLLDGRSVPFWNATAACCGAPPRDPDDVGYLRAVLADVEEQMSVDAKRVFALGVSNGGFMAHRWACEPGGDLTGLVSISGAAPGSTDPPCRATVPVHVLQIHGTDDVTVRYDGGRMDAPHPSARASALSWCARDGCSPDARSSKFRTREWYTQPTTSELWKGSKARVALWTVEGAGHQLDARPAATDAILDFLTGEGWVAH